MTSADVAAASADAAPFASADALDASASAAGADGGIGASAGVAVADANGPSVVMADGGGHRVLHQEPAVHEQNVFVGECLNLDVY